MNFTNAISLTGAIAGGVVSFFVKEKTSHLTLLALNKMNETLPENFKFLPGRVKSVNTFFENAIFLSSYTLILAQIYVLRRGLLQQ